MHNLSSCLVFLIWLLECEILNWALIRCVFSVSLQKFHAKCVFVLFVTCSATAAAHWVPWWWMKFIQLRLATHIHTLYGNWFTPLNALYTKKNRFTQFRMTLEKIDKCRLEPESQQTYKWTQCYFLVSVLIPLYVVFGDFVCKFLHKLDTVYTICTANTRIWNWNVDVHQASLHCIFRDNGKFHNTMWMWNVLYSFAWALLLVKWSKKKTVVFYWLHNFWMFPNVCRKWK